MELARRVRSACLEGYGNADVAFHEVVDTLRVKRDASYSPVFQVMFTLLDEAGPGGPDELAGGPTMVDDVPMAWQSSKFDVDLTVQHGLDGGFLAVFEYCCAMFDAGTAQHMLGHFVVLLGSIRRMPSTAVVELPFMGDDERHRVLVEWNDTHTEYPRDRCVQEFLEESATATAAKPAVMCGVEIMSYGQLRSAAGRLRHSLVALGVRQDIPVGVCMERGSLLFVAIHGILRAGGAYVPMEPSFPGDRLLFMISDSETSILVTTIATNMMLPAAMELKVIAIDGPGMPGTQAGDHHVKWQGASPDSLVYIIYTSGSTGQPKGVLVEHGGLVNDIWFVATQMIPQDHYSLALFSTSICFDQSVTELFAPHVARGCVAVVENFLDPQWTALGVTFAVATPTTMDTALQGPALPTSLRSIVIGGEAVSQQLVDRLYSFAHIDGVYNSFGPTECTDQCTTCRLPAGVERTVSIGRPIPNVQVYVLDRHMEPVGVGMVGTLYVGGKGVSRGYLKRPEQDQKQFVPNLFGSGRIYNTGDLVRWRDDARLEYVGRVDEQVKLHGHRIELGEIEAVVQGHDSVLQCAVSVQTSEHRGQFLAAYITATVQDAPGHEVGHLPHELSRHCAQALPRYMVPSAWCVLEELPLSNSGKVDRKALPGASAVALGLPDRSTRVQPRTRTEKVIADIWSELLGVAEIGVHDNFFELGGNSLSAMLVCGFICTNLWKSVSLGAIMAHPTVSELRMHVQELPDIMRLAAKTQSQKAMCLPTQTFMLYFSAPQDDAWMNMAAYWLRGSLNKDALQLSVKNVLLRHGSLTTGFTSGLPYSFSPGSQIRCFQTIQPVASAPLSTTDLTTLERGLARMTALQCMFAEQLRGIRVAESSSLCRFRLYQTAADEHLLCVEAHHAVVDGTSWGLLTDELSTMYNSFGQATPVLPALPLQFTEWSMQQLHRWTSDATAEAITNFVEMMRGGENRGTTLPTDKLRNLCDGWWDEMRPHRTIDLALDRQAVATINEVARSHGYTPFVALAAVLHLWQHGLTGKTDLCMMVTMQGRTDIVAQHMIGSFINDTVLRTDITAAASFVDVLARTSTAWQHTVQLAENAPLAAWDQIFADLRPLPCVPYLAALGQQCDWLVC
jgi:amino acid adenylation domain-containing protein